MTEGRANGLTLSLSYNSSSPNGIFGNGFGLESGFPKSIVRSSRKASFSL